MPEEEIKHIKNNRIQITVLCFIRTAAFKRSIQDNVLNKKVLKVKKIAITIHRAAKV